jgi:predicted Zn-dependent protease
MRCRGLLGCLLLFGSATAGALSEQEQRARILYEANQSSHVIQEVGALYGDQTLDSYLQQIVDRLYPEQQGRLHVHAFNATSFNAFAMPNGQLYIHIGTLLRLDSEAQLASVLGHEGAHYTQDHIYKWIHSAKISMPILTVVGASVGFAALGQIAGVSTVMGMSRDHEREADEVGFAHMVRAGYAADAGGLTFRRLLREIDNQKIKQPIFFASHPNVQERIDNFDRLARGQPAGGETRRDAYLEVTRNVRVAALDHIWKQNNGKLLVFLLEDEKLIDTLPSYGRFYLAEGYRLRNDVGDSERALALYRAVLRTDAQYAPTYAALGRYQLKAGDKTEALAMFRQYLALAPQATDREFVEQYVAMLEKETGK